MGSHRVPRPVDGQGELSLDNRPCRSVGVVEATRTVGVGCDPVERAWTFQDGEVHEIRRQVARELSREWVCGMEVSHRGKGAQAAIPAVRIRSTNLPFGDRMATTQVFVTPGYRGEGYG
jgi:hypothetical protein